MLQVNLLPWRETHRNKRFRFWHWLLLIGVAMEIVLIVLFAWRSQQQLRQSESRQAEFNASHNALQAQLETVNKLKNAVQRAELLALQSQQRFERSLRYTKLLQHLSQVIPPGVWVTQLHHSGDQFKLDGQGESYSNILALSESLKRESLLPQVQLREVKQLATGSLYFSFNAALASLENE